MKIARGIAIALLASAVVMGGWEVARWVATGSYKAISAGELWFAIDRGSLNLMQAVTQRYIAPWLWDPVVVAILKLPVWALLGVPGALVLWCARGKRGTRARFRRDTKR